jgi:hypothetical protein
MSEYISICPKCHQRILCDTAYAGKSVACPVCLQVITMPEPPAGNENRSVPPVARTTPISHQPPSGQAVSRVPGASAPAGAKRKFPVLAVGVGALILILAAGIGVWALQRRPQAAVDTNAKPAVNAANAGSKAVEPKIVDWFQPGESQSELDHKFQGLITEVGVFNNRQYRHATNGGWFSFEMKLDPAKISSLVCTWWGGEDGYPRTFDILLDDRIIATQTLRMDKPGEFFDITYGIPEAIASGKQKVTVKFAAHPGNYAGGIFACRTISQ